MTKSKLFVFLLALSFVVAPSAWASELETAPAYSTTPVGEASQKGKTMAEFIVDAEKGFPEPFSEDEVMAVMDASRRVKKQDREFARKLERIASKMANLR